MPKHIHAPVPSSLEDSLDFTDATIKQITATIPKTTTPMLIPITASIIFTLFFLWQKLIHLSLLVYIKIRQIIQWVHRP